MREILEQIDAGLRRLAESGNVRPDGESVLSGLRVSVSQLLDDDAITTQAAAEAQPEPVDVQLAALGDKVELLAAKVWQLAESLTPATDKPGA